jgi:hypothetical protein
MRSAERQSEFLEHERFGGEETLTPTKVDQLLWIGLPFLLGAGVAFGSAVVLGIGRDDGGPFFVMAPLPPVPSASCSVSEGHCVCGLDSQMFAASSAKPNLSCCESYPL